MTDSQHNLVEPPIDPVADTNPSLTIRPVKMTGQALPSWRRTAGLISLLGAAALTLATTFLLLSPGSEPAPPAPPPTVTGDAAQVTITLMPTDQIPPTLVADNNPVFNNIVPTISPDLVLAILNQPLAPVPDNLGARIVRDRYEPFTLVPERPRSEVIQYTAVSGDTIYTIAQRFGLKPETIAWSNSRRIVQVLRPGDVINVLPVDGVYYQVTGSKTIAQIASDYKVDDPYTIIDSPFNNLSDATPDTIPVNGSWVVVPGGEAEQIVWNPGVKVEESGERRGYVSVFAPGDPGSCGNVQNPGGGAAWGPPIRSAYTITRGYSSWHTGIDLATAEGTPVYAANSGAVVFSGWSTWGYGYTIVLAHGPYLTLYGHLSSINVGCGQGVSVGQVIGAVGNTGNSSGPHLHFEIRDGDIPRDPSATMPF